MDIIIKKDIAGVDWDAVAALLAKADMGEYPADFFRKAFENSYSVAFAYDEGTLIALGRALSDGLYEGALYDVAVDPDRQGEGIGRMIIEALMQDLEGFNVILYSSPGKEGFYRRLGFSAMKTGFAVFGCKDPIFVESLIER